MQETKECARPQVPKAFFGCHSCDPSALVGPGFLCNAQEMAIEISALIQWFVTKIILTCVPGQSLRTGKRKIGSIQIGPNVTYYLIWTMAILKILLRSFFRSC